MVFKFLRNLAYPPPPALSRMHTIFKILSTLFNTAMLVICFPGLFARSWPGSGIWALVLLSYTLMLLATYRPNKALKVIALLFCVLQLFTNWSSVSLRNEFEILMTIVSIGGPIVTVLAAFQIGKPKAPPSSLNLSSSQH